MFGKFTSIIGCYWLDVFFKNFGSLLDDRFYAFLCVLSSCESLHYQKSVLTSYDSDNEVFSDILTDDGSACIDNLRCGGLRV